MSYNSVFRMIGLVVLLLGYMGVAQAVLVINSYQAADGDEQAYAGSVLATDLVNSGQSTLAGVNVTGYTPVTTPAKSIDAPDYILSDGSNGGFTWLDPSMVTEGAFDVDGAFTVTYNLNTAVNTAGYDLKTIRTFTAHLDNRVSQFYTVAVKYVGDNVFTDLLMVERPYSGGNFQAQVVTLENDIGAGTTPFATGVAAIRFDINPGTAPASVWREIDVLGTASAVPEPGTFVLSACGLLSLLTYGWRSRK